MNTVVGGRSETKLKQLVEVPKKIKCISRSRARAKQGSPLPAVQTSLKGAGSPEASLEPPWGLASPSAAWARIRSQVIRTASVSPAARKTPGDSLLGAVGHLEHGALSG